MCMVLRCRSAMPPEKRLFIMNNTITIVSIEWADNNVGTDVVHLVHLSDGRTLEIASGQSSYEVYDELEGAMRVGAKLDSVYDDGTHDVYKFTA